MGFDLHGQGPFKGEPKKPDFEPKDWDKYTPEEQKVVDKYLAEKEIFQHNNPGVYFRNNVWHWRPLWHYVTEAACSDLIPDEVKQYGQFNDGHIIDAELAIKIADRLYALLETNAVVKYDKEYRQQLLDLEEESEEEKFAKMYPFSVDNVKEFADFCWHSNGFRIC